MQTNIADFIKDTQEGKRADEILRACVHCGFCNATCPTYQILGDENDGPRGRIYLIKQLLEGKHSGEKTLKHLDQCLVCRSCETTCPSGVEYSHLLDIGRKIAEEQIPREPKDAKMRKNLLKVLPYTNRFSAVLKAGRLTSPLLPKKLKSKIPPKQIEGEWPTQVHERKMLVLDGCVQPALAPDTNATTARVLDKLGITLIRESKAGCCGAVSQHMNAHDAAIQSMKQNIDAWWPHVKDGIEAIVMTASGCGSMVKDYYHHLRYDREYSIKSKRISELCKDLSEIIPEEDYSILAPKEKKTIAWHPPCSLQHGQKVTGKVEKVLTDLGYTLQPIKDSHLCCGSAGTYSILQENLANQLKNNKLKNLNQGQPDLIATANIGCQMHLKEDSGTPVIHWIDLLDQ